MKLWAEPRPIDDSRAYLHRRQVGFSTIDYGANFHDVQAGR